MKIKMNHVSYHHLEKSRKLHKTYFAELEKFYGFVIPQGMRVLELGCHTGRLLASVKPRYGLGIDINPEAIDIARKIHKEKSHIEFRVGDIEHFEWSGFDPFDYIILSDLTPVLKDIQETLSSLHAICHSHTRLIFNFHNNVWNIPLRIASCLGMRSRLSHVNWLSTHDIENLLYLSDFQPVTKGTRVLLPLGIPFFSSFANRFLVKLPFFRHFGLTCYIIARPAPSRTYSDSLPTVSIVIPTRNERGNIEAIFKRTPRLGKWTELIFVDGASTDGTVEAILQGIETHQSEWHRVELLHQTGKGKGQAVRQAFKECSGDILMILDSDLTVPPEDLPKFFHAIASGKGEFINGSRLVYPMEKQAMRFLNMIANKLFAILFSWLLDQPVKDTLCGTKVLWKHDYLKIDLNRSYFGDFDPFGDFDLLFGASRFNLKIIDLPIRYRERTYGDIKIHRWKHGWLLLKMCFTAFRKLKLY